MWDAGSLAPSPSVGLEESTWCELPLGGEGALLLTAPAGGGEGREGLREGLGEYRPQDTCLGVCLPIPRSGRKLGLEILRRILWTKGRWQHPGFTVILKSLPASRVFLIPPPL